MDVNYNFKLKPFDHQKQALNTGWDRIEFGLFMEMGTGKSKVLIDHSTVYVKTLDAHLVHQNRNVLNGQLVLLLLECLQVILRIADLLLNIAQGSNQLT